VEFFHRAVVDNGALVARPVGLRVYLVASGDGYRVMPAASRACCRQQQQFHLHATRRQQQQGHLDRVRNSRRRNHLAARTTQNVELRRTGNNLPSRLADNFFWLGRYSERADATARLLRSALLRFNPERTGSALPLLAPLLTTLETQGQLPGIWEQPDLRQNSEAFEAELLAAIFDPMRPGSCSKLLITCKCWRCSCANRTSNDCGAC